MANFTTAIAEENEIIKAADVSFGYEAAINNVALALQGVLGSSSGNYVIGGTVTPYSGGGLNVMVSPIYAYCADTGVAVVETDTTGPISLEEEEDSDRIDIIEVRGVEEGYDYQVRMFNDPSSGTKSSESINTKKQISLSVTVKKGTPGAGSAPSVDAGYIKLAEVTVYTDNNAIQESQIANITARSYGAANDGWTTDATATYNPGELTEAFSSFLVAHNEDGSHKDGVIDGDDIDWGTGTSQVKGTLMPTGQSTRLYTDGKLAEWTSSEKVTPLLLALVEHINKLYPFANNILSRYTVAEVSPVAATNGEEVDVSTGGTMTIDGVAVSDGQAVLLKDQTDATQNGIWSVSETGAWTRYEGFAAKDSEALTHKLIQVTGGTENSGKVYYLEGDSYQIGTDALAFVESGLSPQALPNTVAIRDADGQLDGGRVVIPTATPASTVDGLIWLTENYINGAIGGKSYKAPLRESVDCLYNGKFHVYTVAGLLAWNAYMTAAEDYSIDCVLHNSLDMTGVEWTPVADYVNTSQTYTGTFDGAGHSLHNLTIELTTNYTGFISYLGSGGEVRNLHLVGGSVSGGNNTGGIAGRANGAISNCTNSGAVSGSGTHTGGIAGYVYSSTVSNCTNSGSVTGSGSTGGIAGYASYATISNCANKGAISDTVSGNSAYAGGICGYAAENAAILACANGGAITARSSNYTSGQAGAGGIVGKISAQSSSYRAVVAGCVAGYGTSCSASGTNNNGAGYIAGILGTSASTTASYNVRVAGPSSEVGITTANI